MSTFHRRVHGFTLLELMFSVAIGATLIGIGVPSFQNFVRSSRITSNSNELLTAVYTTRSEAIKRRATTILCFTSDANAALPDCAGDGSQGWVVWVDVANLEVPSAGDRNGRVDAGEQVIIRHGALPNTLRTRTQPAGNGGYLAYAASGTARPIAAAGTQVIGIVICDDRGNAVVTAPDTSAARGLIFSAAGRPRVTSSVVEINGSLSLRGCP
jgi:type IV fimbrial biogenesis protein FimT